MKAISRDLLTYINTALPQTQNGHSRDCQQGPASSIPSEAQLYFFYRAEVGYIQQSGKCCNAKDSCHKGARFFEDYQDDEEPEGAAAFAVSDSSIKKEEPIEEGVNAMASKLSTLMQMVILMMSEYGPQFLIQTLL